MDPDGPDLLPWFVGALSRCISVRTVQIEFKDNPGLGLSRGPCLRLRNTLEVAMTPVCGPAQSFVTIGGLRFYPQDYLNSLPREVDVDWMDRLDGIRLSWNQGTPTNAHEPNT